MKTTTILPFSKDMKFLISRKLAKQGLTGLIFFLFPFLVFSQTWTGNSSDDWNTGANWTGNAVPGAASTTVVIPSTVTSGRWPKLTGDVNVGVLTMNSGAQIDLNGKQLNVQYGVNINNVTINDASGGSGMLRSGSNSANYNANFDIQNSVFHSKAWIQVGGNSTSNRTLVWNCTFNKELTVFHEGHSILWMGNSTLDGSVNTTFPNTYNDNVIVYAQSRSASSQCVLEMGQTGKNTVFKGNVTVSMNSGSNFFGPGHLGGSFTIEGNYSVKKSGSSGAVYLGANSQGSSATLNVKGDLIYEVAAVATNNTTYLGANPSNGLTGVVNVTGKLDMRINGAWDSDFFIRNVNNSAYTGTPGDIVVSSNIGRVEISNCNLVLDSLFLVGADYSNVLDNRIKATEILVPHNAAGSRTFIDGNRFDANVRFRLNVATSGNDYFISGSRTTASTGAKGNAYLRNLNLELGGTVNGQMQIGRYGTDSIYGNLDLSNWGIGDLYMIPYAGRLYVGGNATFTQTGTGQGYLYISYDGNVEIKGDFSITAPNTVLDFNMNTGKKISIGGKFNFDGNHTGSPTMTFGNFEVATNGGIFRTGAKATGGTSSSVGPGKLIIRNSILRDSIYEIYDISNADIFDSQFFGDSLYLDQTLANSYTYIDGNKFNIRSSAFAMDLINQWVYFESGRRGSGTFLGNAYRGNVYVKTAPATSTVYYQSHWGRNSMDSIYGNFTADLKEQSQLYFASENATNSKVWIGGNVDVNVPGTAQTGGFLVGTGNATVVGNLDVFWPRGTIDFTPTSPNKFTVGGTFSLDGGVLNDVVNYDFQFFEVGTAGGTIKTGIKATGGTNRGFGPGNLDIRNSTLRFGLAEFYGMNRFDILDSKFYGDSLFVEAHIDGTTSFLDGNLFDVKGVAVSGNRSINSNWMYIDSGARVFNSTSNAKGNTYKGNLRILNLGDLNGAGGGALSFRLGSGATDSIYGNVDVYMEDYSQLQMAPASASLSKVWIGGNFNFLNKDPITGYLWAQTGSVTIKGNMDVKAPSWVDLSFTPDSPNKFIVDGTFNFDGNVNSNYAMDFQFFEVGKSGGTFKTGSAATGGIASSAGPGKITIKNSILRNTQYDWYGVDHADLFDNQFFGDSLFMDQTTGNWTLIDGNKFNIRSTAFTSNVLNNWMYYQSGSRIANNISGAKGNAYRGNVRFAQLNTSVNNYIQAYIGFGAMDSIYGNLCADLRDFGYLYLAHANANLSKVWVGGDMKLNSPTIGQLGYLYATT